MQRLGVLDLIFQLVVVKNQHLLCDEVAFAIFSYSVTKLQTGFLFAILVKNAEISEEMTTSSSSTILLYSDPLDHDLSSFLVVLSRLHYSGF